MVGHGESGSWTVCSGFQELLPCNLTQIYNTGVLVGLPSISERRVNRKRFQQQQLILFEASWLDLAT